MSSRRHHNDQDDGGPASSINHTYNTLKALSEKLRSTKITERRSASKELLERLQDSSTLRKLDREAEHYFNNAMQRSASGRDRSHGNNDPNVMFPWERNCVAYRGLMNAALVMSQILVLDGGSSSDSTVARSKKRNHANHTGFTKKAVKFNADDVLFPYKVFLKMDMDQNLECNDGGYSGSGTSWEKDWKTRPRYGHHIDITTSSSSSSASSSSSNAKNAQHGRFSATHYTPHTYTDRDRGSRLSTKEITACVDYCIECLNDDDCCNFAETSLLTWLVHICSRPEYLAVLPMQHQISYILNELSVRLNRAFFEDGHTRGILPPEPRNKNSKSRRNAIAQDSLLAVAKCLSALIYNCTTRLGMGMHLYIRPVIELVAVWAENAWQIQSEGDFASSAEALFTQTQQHQSNARNPHSKMIEEGQINPSLHRRKLRTEADIVSLMPYLYSSVTHLLVAHPEHSLPILSDHGHALLRLARRNYARPTTNVQTRDALTEYISAHLLVAETSGKLCGLPEGDLGPLVPRDNTVDDQGQNGGGGDQEGKEGHGKKKKSKKKRKGATLDAKAINKLLELVRNEKVWESLFFSAASGQDAKKKARRSLPGRKRGRSSGGMVLAEGGATWTPLSRRQRRHLELMARLVRISQRLYLADAEDRGNGTIDSLESLVEHAEEMMQKNGIEQGEIDILPKGESGQQRSFSSDMDERHIATPDALACSPWIRMVCRHLYKLNPKLGNLATSSMDTSFTQGALHFTMGTQGATQITQSGSSDDLLVSKDDDGTLRILLESCPLLQALAIDENTLTPESSSAMATMTQGTLTASLTASTPTKTNKNTEALDSIRPTTIATLQFLCACAEAFPRGECWTSSTRRYWSTILDESSYPAGISANILERHGSSPADAAAIVYLLGTTLEKHGGSGGDTDIQLWVLVTLLKMVDSSAIICSREGLSDVASFGSHSQLEALRVAWQYVWKTLFRYDLRYSSYTSGAFGNNVGELVLQLLTQMIRYQCVDRKSLFVCQPAPSLDSSVNLAAGQASSKFPFVHGEKGRIWKLPVFEQDEKSIVSCAPFELMSTVIQHTGFYETGEAALTAPSSSNQVARNDKDRSWFISFCLRFIELSMEDTAESKIRRTFLPFAATSLASLISDGGITPNITSIDLDGLTRFAVTEDTEPNHIPNHPDDVDIESTNKMSQIYATLWAKSVTPSEYLNDTDRGLAHRIIQGRGAFLNQHVGAQYERLHLLKYMKCSSYACKNAGHSTQINALGTMPFDKIKGILDDLTFRIKYDDGGTSDEDGNGIMDKLNNAALTLPQLSGCLSLILTVTLSAHSNAKDVSKNIADAFVGTFAPTFDLLVENLPSLKGFPSDLLTVFNHLHGIVRVLTFIAAVGGEEATIPRLFSNQAKSLFTVCKSLLRDYRNEAFTSGSLMQLGSQMRNDSESDSDEERNISRLTQLSQGRAQHNSMYLDDSDGLMDDDDDDDNKNFRPKKQRAPPIKRRRIGNGSSRAREKRETSRKSELPCNSVDNRGAWAIASFMLVLQPSFQCVELITAHLVWPEDKNHLSRYGIVSKTPDPYGALVCASLFCQKSVILRGDRLDLLSGRSQDDEEDQVSSAFILSIEVILQARRYISPSSEYFMSGLGLTAGLVRLGDYSESCGPVDAGESQMVLEGLYPEGVGKGSEDYHQLKQWKKILKYRSSYRAAQSRAAILSFIYAQTNLRKEFESSIGPYFMHSSFRQLDESTRGLACDVLGAALGAFADQRALAEDVLKNTLPSLGSDRKFTKWVDSLADMKLREDLTSLEEEALSDASDSIAYHSIECIGLIAGSTSDVELTRQMIWKLIDLASKKPTLLLQCYRACKRASFLLGLKSVHELFDSMMPHLLVKWLESQRSLRDFPLLLMSPSSLERACQYLPNEVLSTLLSGTGWSDDFFQLDETEGEPGALTKRLLMAFVTSVANFLIPSILLSASGSDDGPETDLDNERIDTTKYLTECVVVLTEVDSDENVARVLVSHISDLYAYVAVLAMNKGATDEECENAFKLLKRCVSGAIIERTGARDAHLVLRHILLLHQKGISVVGLGSIELTPSSFIEGMKYVAKQMKTSSSSNRKQDSFLEQLGSSMTESFVLVKFWLSSSQTVRQREGSWDTMMLLCNILAENIQVGKIESGELVFCLHAFIAILMDINNYEICPSVLRSLKAVLDVLYSSSTDASLVDGTLPILQKLSLALLQIHQRAVQKLYASCEKTLCCIEYEQKASQGLLSASEDAQKCWDSLGEAPWKVSPKRDEVLKQIITLKADLEEKVTSETMLGAYTCLESIANSGKMQLSDILGAEDVLLQSNQKDEIFRSVNEKYSMLSFFNSIQQSSSTAGTETNLASECEHFIRIMNDHPVSTDDFDTSSSNSSHDVLARLLALRRLERVLSVDRSSDDSAHKSHAEIYPFLLSICHSGDPEESRVASSRCLGELALDCSPRNTNEHPSPDGEDESLGDPILSMKRTFLTLLGQSLLSECSSTSMVAMKTAKALLVTPAGKECWQSLGGDIKELLRPFNTTDEGKLRREAVRITDSCLEQIKSMSVSSESDSWCWSDELWSSIHAEGNSCDLWIRRITASIISCCFCKGTKVGKADQDFFRITQGMCAKEASFAASIFPALIFHLLDSEVRDQCGKGSGVREIILSNNAIGSPTSGINKVISHCFSLILSPEGDSQADPKAITLVLNTLELFRAITEHRFLTSPEHAKNKAKASAASKQNTKKRSKSRNHDSADPTTFASSPKWRGFSYGVVLRVSGLDVAKSCFQVKRYYSALYYAEMTMQNLIGSGTFFEDVANQSPRNNGWSAVCDISGFGVTSQQEEGANDTLILQKALDAQEIIRSCLSELAAKDEMHGVLSQGSALELKQNITTLSTIEGCRRDQPLSMLLDLDNSIETSNRAGISNTTQQVAGCLEDLGLNHIKHNYLAGIENNLSINDRSEGTRRYLRETWFQDALNKTSQWDDSLLPRMNEDDTAAALLYDTSHHAADVMSHYSRPALDSQSTASFYESVHGSLQSFARNALHDGLGHVLQGRKSVLADIELLSGSEAQTTGMVSHLSKLTVLGQLEQVAKTLEGKCSLSDTLKRWGFQDSTGGGAQEPLILGEGANFDAKDQINPVDGALFHDIRLGLSVKELSLKILASKLSSGQEEIVNASLTSHIYNSCCIYRELGHADAAKVSLSSLRSLIQQVIQKGASDTCSTSVPLMLRLEDAKIMKSQNDLEGAVMHCKLIASHLQHLGDETKRSVDVERDQICAESLLLGGLWMAQHNVDATESILSSYFEKAADLSMKIHKKAPSTSSVHRAAIANFKLGEFAANLYNSVEASVSSEAWKRRNIVAAEERKKELETVTSELELAKKRKKRGGDDETIDLRITQATLEREVEIANRELESVEQSLRRYLRMAVESYCNALKLCPTTITADVAKHVFQLVSLWFKNCQKKGTQDLVNELLRSNISQIPSFRLVPLTYQLFSRIDEMQDDGFQSTLRNVVIKICSEHPYHGIVQLLALSNGKRVGGGVNGRHADAYLENVGSSKVDAVNSIIEELRKVAPAYVSSLIDSYSTLMNSFMNVAELDTSSIQKRTTKGLSFKNNKLDLDCCFSSEGGGRRGKRNTSTTNMPAIITKPPCIRPDLQYCNGLEDPIGTERVVSFESTFDLTLTGLHRPKIVKCIGSKGTRFKQLVKGEDDLRQDAIMQQVFETVNDLLRQEGSSGNELIKKSTIGSTRQLRLITYGITPLSPASGVLEWVDNTMCFGDFLSDRGKNIGVHSRYFPGEWGESDVRQYYRMAAEAHNATPESKREAFEKICENFSPAFRFFFLEYFNSSMEAWHTARTLYTRSCAVNSIVGHILGIGDRHTSNILVHTKTGEVVHIDFGIVFEQGKTLTTPELVPFRLTRDIVDGFGPCGTDGVFSKAAEATMGVLRTNADTLLTILSAVVSDPLYKWSLSPAKAKEHQRKSDSEEDSKAGILSVAITAAADENRNDAADRAIAKIHAKLEGYEDGTSGEHKTVAGQVKLLINEARDPGNLGALFAGWAPWM